MQRHVAITVVTLLVSSVAGGCLTNDGNEAEEEHVIMASLGSMLLAVDDLPHGYNMTLDENESGDRWQEKPLIESHDCKFRPRDENATGLPIIEIDAYKYHSTADAAAALHSAAPEMRRFLSTEFSRTTPSSVKTVGDNSTLERFQGQTNGTNIYENLTWTYILFRVDNVLIHLCLWGDTGWDLDQVALTVGYAETMARRMENEA